MFSVSSGVSRGVPLAGSSTSVVSCSLSSISFSLLRCVKIIAHSHCVCPHLRNLPNLVKGLKAAISSCNASAGGVTGGASPVPKPEKLLIFRPHYRPTAVLSSSCHASLIMSGLFNFILLICLSYQLIAQTTHIVHLESGNDTLIHRLQHRRCVQGKKEQRDDVGPVYIGYIDSGLASVLSNMSKNLLAKLCLAQYSNTP